MVANHSHSVDKKPASLPELLFCETNSLENVSMTITILGSLIPRPCDIYYICIIILSYVPFFLHSHFVALYVEMLLGLVLGELSLKTRSALSLYFQLKKKVQMHSLSFNDGQI